MSLTSSERSPGAAKVLILGMGDLGAQIARVVTENRFASSCLLAGSSPAAMQWAQLLQMVTGGDVEGRQVDALDMEALSRLLADYEPDRIVQCASLLSPFALAKSDSPAAKAVLQGGWGALHCVTDDETFRRFGRDDASKSIRVGHQPCDGSYGRE